MRRAQHLEREVDSDHVGPAFHRELCQVARSTGEIDDAISVPDANAIERLPSPALVEPGGEQAIQAVVARRDLVEHRAYT